MSWAAVKTPAVTLFALLIMAAGHSASEDCLACHSDSGLSTQKRGKTRSLFVDSLSLRHSVHASLACSDCHPGLNPEETPHAKTLRPVNCQGCHDINGYKQSVHGRRGATCKDCHGTHAILSHSDSSSLTHRASLSSLCSHCHARVSEHYTHSAHGVALQKGVKGAPTCTNCHGEHTIEPVASDASNVSKSHEAAMCMRCHWDNPDIRKKVGPSAGFIKSYENSVHGMAVVSGNRKAATCSDCHGAHDMKHRGDPGSHVGKLNIAQTCARCHAEIAKIFDESIHGVALKAGIQDAPACTDCHGEHQILASTDPSAKVSARNVSAQVCAACHASVQLSAKYGIPSERFQTFSDSYHGLALRSGSVAVANCASCHGVHNIKPSSDSTSTISKANIAATCGRCHPGANKNFAKGSVHVGLTRDHDAILYWIRLFYLCLIGLTIGGMIFHNSLDFFKKFRRRLRVRSGQAFETPAGGRAYLRMTLNERLQHGLLLISFIVLTVTGFMLKFPEAWWVIPLRHLSEQVFAVRGLAHRAAAVILILTSLYHLGYLAFTPRGRRLAKDMLPCFKDVRDALGFVLHNLGLSKSRPRFDRFSYIEKSEYWALLWGTLIMSVTGVLMWFDNYFIGLFTKLGWDISRTIHYYEACLAALAIVVWHFYFVILNLDIYPMKTTWFTGKISEAEMLEEHPLELERIRAAETKPSGEQSEPAPPGSKG